jgi:hypothetical protein
MGYSREKEDRARDELASGYREKSQAMEPFQIPRLPSHEVSRLSDARGMQRGVISPLVKTQPPALSKKEEKNHWVKRKLWHAASLILLGTGIAIAGYGLIPGVVALELFFGVTPSIAIPFGTAVLSAVSYLSAGAALVYGSYRAYKKRSSYFKKNRPKPKHWYDDVL